jgi:hypothetical protein
MDNFKETAPVVRTYYEYLPEPFIDGDNPNFPNYVGYAPLGVRTSDAKWRIVKYNTNGTVREALYPQGSMDFAFVWDDRETYNYGR